MDALRCSSAKKMLVVLLITAETLCLASAAVIHDTTDGDDSPTSPTGNYRFGAVATDAEICSQIGTYVLAHHGGSAVDAAIASLLCLGVVDPQSTGIGGGFLMTTYDSKKDEVTTLNSREVAPAGASEKMYVGTGASSTIGGMAIAVPAEIAGMAAAHARYGKLPWDVLFEPTIRLCEQGIEVTHALEVAINAEIDNIRSNPTMSKTFLKSDGSPLKEGDTMKRPNLAKTLKTLADDGADAFYRGSLARDIVKDIQHNCGIITLEDLSTYTPVWKKPVSVQLENGGYTLYGPPPPSSALILQYMLLIMDGYSMSSADVSSFEPEVLTEHRMIEALKFGFAKRSYLGDEDFVDVKQWKRRLSRPSYAERSRVQINDSSVLPFDDYGAGFEIVEDSGTTHLTIFGADGSVVSVTSTINLYFGSQVQGFRTGIIFNNQMDDFSTPNTTNAFGVPASPSNFIAPGKRPMSSMSPTVVKGPDGNVRMAVGASGGTRIITGTFEVLLNSLWLGYDLTDAVDKYRLHHQLLPDYVRYETGMPQEHIDALKEKGHKFQKNTGIFCVVQAIVNTCSDPPTGSRDYMDYCIQATSDVRKGGVPDGY